MAEYARDAAVLKEVLSGKEKDWARIAQMIARRTNKERLMVRREYEALNGGETIEKCFEKAGLKGDIAQALISFFLSPLDFDCKELYDSMKGLGTRDEVLCEIITTRPNCILGLIKDKYAKLYKKTLEDDVTGDTSGSYMKLLLHLLAEKKSSNMKPDMVECEKIAKSLYEAGEKKLGTDEAVFIGVFGSKSPIELTAIDLYYKTITSHSLSEAIDKEFSGDMKILLTTLFDVSFSQSKFFAKRLNVALKEKNVKDIVRILISRKEVDLARIAQFYYSLYQHHFIKDIEEKVDKNMKLLLLEFVKSY